MIILGINGFKREHDPSAALIIDGKLIGFVEEERFNRIKRSPRKYPRNSVAWLLKKANISIEEIDIFAFGWDIPKLVSSGYTNEFTDNLQDNNYIVELVTGLKRQKKAEIVYVQHHLAHAAASYYASGFEESSIIVIDGYGEDSSISCYHGKDSNISLIRSWNKAFSLGVFYEAASIYCGFTDWDAGKTMGLAAYANGEQLDDFIRWDNDELIIFDKFKEYPSKDIISIWIEKFNNRFGKRKDCEKFWSPIENRYVPIDRKSVQHYNPVAASCAQESLVGIIRNLVEYTVNITGSNNISLGGGVGLNCASNGKLLNKYNNLYIFPASNDAGVSFGAAAYVAAQNGDKVEQINSALNGPSYTTEDIHQYLEKCGVNYQKVDNPEEIAVDYLLSEKIVGWFQGQLESGPRALGARSILAMPYGNPGSDKVNNVKCRELWRPFAPSMLYDEQKDLFTQDTVSRFMLLGLQCKQKANELIPAAIHVDNTSRPHTVLPEDGAYYELLKLMKERTGHGIVLNTSFNGPAEPIVCNPKDAIRTFFSSEMDSLVIDKFVVFKKGV